MTAKLYTKNTWVDEVLADDARYDIKEDDGTPIQETVQVVLSTGVTTAGSPVNASRMNNLENGLDAVDTLLAILNELPDGTMLNGKITPSVASNDLTVAIKTNAGTDPSASDPVKIKIEGTWRTITAALSVTAAAATNWFGSGGTGFATVERKYYVYVGYNATDGVTLGFSPINPAYQYSDFNTTSTAATYCKISTIANAAAADKYANVGRFSATLSAGAGYTWSVPTFTPNNLVQRPCHEPDSGTWTPTVGTTAGADAAAASGQGQFMRVGRVVTGSLSITIDSTTAGTQAKVYFTLPFPSNLTNAVQLSGSISGPNVAGFLDHGTVHGDPTNDRAEVEIIPSTANNRSYYIIFQMLIL